MCCFVQMAMGHLLWMILGELQLNFFVCMRWVMPSIIMCATSFLYFLYVQDCAVGYNRVRNGPYLGTCQRCRCNDHSSDCDPITGQCRVRLICFSFYHGNTLFYMQSVCLSVCLSVHCRTCTPDHDIKWFWNEIVWYDNKLNNNYSIKCVWMFLFFLFMGFQL